MQIINWNYRHRKQTPTPTKVYSSLTTIQQTAALTTAKHHVTVSSHAPHSPSPAHRRRSELAVNVRRGAAARD